MSGGTDTLKGANVSKCIPRPLLANSCEVRFSETGILRANSSSWRLHRKVRCIGGTILHRSYEDSALNRFRSTRDLQLVQFGVCRPPND